MIGHGILGKKVREPGASASGSLKSIHLTLFRVRRKSLYGESDWSSNDTFGHSRQSKSRLEVTHDFPVVSTKQPASRLGIDILGNESD